MRSFLESRLAGLVAICITCAPAPNLAQEYPAKPVRLVTGNIGTASDFVSRQVSQRLSERWGQAVVVDNRGGANATIAANAVAKATPDGYTLLMGQLASHAAAPHLYKNLAYDPLKDFEPITLVARIPLVLVAHPAAPAENLRQFIEYAKARPGEITYSSGGSGTASNLTMALFTNRGELTLLHVPYKGNALALTALLSREAEVSFLPMPVALPQIEARRLKAYGITSLKRFPDKAEIPTLDEAGMPGFEASTWFGMFGPAGTPAKRIGRLNRDMIEVLGLPTMRAALLAQGAEAAPGTPQEFAKFVESEIAKWGKAIKGTGVSPE